MRKKTVLIALVILALGLVGTGLSALYWQQDGQITEKTADKYMFTFKVSYGFPVAWHGYSGTGFSWLNSYWGAPLGGYYPEIYWFSLGSLLLDAAFWFAISSFVSFVAIASARALNHVVIAHARVLGMKTSIILLVMSLLFIVIGAGLCLVAQTSALAKLGIESQRLGRMEGYLDVGLRLIGSGTASLIATLSVMVWKPSSVRVRPKYVDNSDFREV
jgi:hypothetical protein